MDFSAFEPTEEPLELVLVHPKTKQPLPDSVITVFGMDSKRAARIKRKQQNRKFANGVQRFKLTAEELESDSFELLVGLTHSWRGIGMDGTEDIPCTPENVRMLYERVPDIKEQVDNFIGDRSVFLPRSETS